MRLLAILAAAALAAAASAEEVVFDIEGPRMRLFDSSTAARPVGEVRRTDLLSDLRIYETRDGRHRVFIDAANREFWIDPAEVRTRRLNPGLSQNQGVGLGQRGVGAVRMY